MYNTCVSSTVSFRCKGSLSYSHNDYSHFLRDGIDRHPIPYPFSSSSSSSSCCSCCSNSSYRVPITPSYLYGLRQSTLIQWLPTKRLILGGGDRYYHRFPTCDLNEISYFGKSSSSIRESRVRGRRGRWREGTFGCMASEEKSSSSSSSSRKYPKCDMVDAEVMLSLLTEVSEECFGGRERKGRSSTRAELGNRDNRGGICYSCKNKIVGSGFSESDSRCDSESATIRSKEENYRRKEDREKEDKENSSRGENRRLRKEGSGCSTYYSFSSSGEFESDGEVRVEDERFVGDSSSGYKRDLKHKKEVVEGVKEHRESSEGHEQEVADVGSYKLSSGLESEWRKKSEKKLSEISKEQTESKKESSQKHSRLLEVDERDYRKASGTHKQSYNKGENLTSSVNIDEGTRRRHNATAQQVSGESESRMRYKQFEETTESRGSEVVTNSSSKKQFRVEEVNLGEASSVQERTDRHQKTAGRFTREDEYRQTSQQLDGVSEVQEIDIRGTSASRIRSETDARNQSGNSTRVTSYVHGAEEELHEESERITRIADSRKKIQQLTEISDNRDTVVAKETTSNREANIKMKKQENVINSGSEAREQLSRTGKETSTRTESRRKFLDKNDLSVVHSTDTERTSDIQMASENRFISHEKYLTSVVKTVEETRERRHIIDERVSQIGSGKEAQMLTKASSSSGGVSIKGSSSQTSLHLKPQAKLQQIDAQETDKRSSQAIVTAPSSQSVERDPQNFESASRFTTPESGHVSWEHSRAGSQTLQHGIHGGDRRDENYGSPLHFTSHEDALGSADRMQKSSVQYVGEFVEKAKQELSLSEVQIGTKSSETTLVSEGRREQLDSGDTKSKKQKSRSSSRGSATKGPSDEMWDVTDPSVQKSLKEEDIAGTSAAENAVAKRTGRSFWNMVADVVQLRWALRSDSHNSTAKSGRRSSPQSVSSEAWFSGHEQDENYDESVKEPRNDPERPESAGLGVPARTTVESSSSRSSKDRTRRAGLETASSSSLSKSGSASKSVSSASGEETFGRKEDLKNHQGTASGTAEAESSVPILAGPIRYPVVEEITEVGQTDVSGGGLMVQMGRPSGDGLSEVPGTGGKDGELKRRKLQRTNQVVRDRFDEWEEAYNLESEQRKIDEFFMREALMEAKRAADNWEVPVGAVLVQNGKIVARGCNLVEELRDSTAHAEMMCIREASNVLRSWRLSEATLYVTLEPCPMCAGAILQARIDTVVWGAPNKLLGADGSWIRLFPSGGEGSNELLPSDKPAAPVHPFHPNMTIRRGVLASECADTMQQFFQLRRKKKDSKTPPPSPPPSCLPIAHHPSKFLTRVHGAFNLMFCL